ncbi:Uncharacterised protein [Yersinia kristensenii]|nr:Uncharacterised protein [Yersinia kristensenii]
MSLFLQKSISIGSYRDTLPNPIILSKLNGWPDIQVL